MISIVKYVKINEHLSLYNLTLQVIFEIFSDVTSSLSSRTTEISPFSTTVVDRLTNDPLRGLPVIVKGSLDRLTFSPSSG